MHPHPSTHNLNSEKLNQHSCNNLALISLHPSLGHLHYIFNQATPPSLFCLLPSCSLDPLTPSSFLLFSSPALLNLALVTVKFIYLLALWSFWQCTGLQISLLHLLFALLTTSCSFCSLSILPHLTPPLLALLCPPSVCACMLHP